MLALLRRQEIRFGWRGPDNVAFIVEELKRRLTCGRLVGNQVHTIRLLLCQGPPKAQPGIHVTIGVLQDEFLCLDGAGAHDRRLQAIGGFRGHQHKRNTEEREENARELPAAVLRFELFDARRQEMQFRLGEVHGPPPYDWPGEILTKLDVRAMRPMRKNFSRRFLRSASTDFTFFGGTTRIIPTPRLKDCSNSSVSIVPSLARYLKIAGTGQAARSISALTPLGSTRGKFPGMPPPVMCARAETQPRAMMFFKAGP